MIEKLVHVPHIAHADSHETDIGTSIGIEIRVHGQQRVFRKQHGLRLGPAVGLALKLPVRARTDHISLVIRIERAVTPIVDIKDHTRKSRIIYSGVMYLETVIDQLSDPARLALAAGYGISRHFQRRHSQGRCKCHDRQQYMPYSYPHNLFET